MVVLYTAMEQWMWLHLRCHPTWLLTVSLMTKPKREREKLDFYLLWCSGGAIFSMNLTSIANSQVNNNTAYLEGGGINSRGPLGITNTSFYNNLCPVNLSVATWFAASVTSGDSLSVVYPRWSTVPSDPSVIYMWAVTSCQYWHRPV